MLHTRVWCRARAWDVIDRRQDEDVTLWRVRHDDDPPRLLASPPDLVQPLEDAPRRASPRAWARHVLGRLRAWLPTWWPSVMLRLPIDPLAWQAVPSILILGGAHRRLLLADPVGTGKTVQAALLLREMHDRDPDATSLIVTPASLTSQWARELHERAGLDPTLIDATRLRAEALQPQRLVDEARRGACWIVSVDLLRQDDVAPLASRTAWTLLVVDEAHMAAPATARLDAIRNIAASSARVLLLTGTPTASGLAGLDALRGIGGRAGEPPMPVLRRDPARSGPRRRTFVCHVRLDARHAALCARLDAFATRARSERGSLGLLPALVLRRRATSCPEALVRSLERRLVVLGAASRDGQTMPPLPFEDQDSLDDEVMRLPAWRDDGAERVELEALLARARTMPPAGRKLEAVERLLRRVGEPAVVFTAYVDTARVLRDRLGGGRLVLVHGRLPDALRAEAIEAFTCGEADVLITTDASAEGLNLHARCRLVIHADLPVSARLLAQRTGRVDRLGQSRRVHEVLLSSDASEDVEVLARLRTGVASESAWLDRHVSDESRRTRLAEACLARAQDAERLSTRHLRARCLCAMAPARWRRLRTRWALPAHATSVQVSRVTVSGATPLATEHLPLVSFTTASREERPTRAAHAGRRIARALARARRIDAWQHDADAHAHGVGARASRRDLFSGDEQRALEPLPAGTPAITTRVLACISLRRPEGGAR